MRNIIIAFVAVFTLNACTRPHTTTTPPTSARKGFIPHWDNEVLRHVVGADSIVTFKSGDTSKLVHKGKTYFIWWMQDDALEGSLPKPFNDSTKVYLFHCWINQTLYDTTFPASMCTIENRIYWNETTSTWANQQLAIGINSRSNTFGVVGSNWYPD